MTQSFLKQQKGFSGLRYNLAGSQFVNTPACNLQSRPWRDFASLNLQHFY
jgi:hypothetical protein